MATLLLATIFLSGCAAPVFRDANGVSPAPAELVARADAGAGTSVVWGGTLLAVRNLADATELHVQAYPLDRDQRPRATAAPTGRFIVRMPGFVEPLEYPPGISVTVRGTVHGVRRVPIDGRAFAYALVDDATVHRWRANASGGGMRIGIGIGVR